MTETKYVMEARVTVRTWAATHEGEWEPVTVEEMRAIEELNDNIGSIIADKTGSFKLTMPDGAIRHFAARSIEYVEIAMRRLT